MKFVSFVEARLSKIIKARRIVPRKLRNIRGGYNWKWMSIYDIVEVDEIFRLKLLFSRILRNVIIYFERRMHIIHWAINLARASDKNLIHRRWIRHLLPCFGWILPFKLINFGANDMLRQEVTTNPKLFRRWEVSKWNWHLAMQLNLWQQRIPKYTWIRWYN